MPADTLPRKLQLQELDELIRIDFLLRFGTSRQKRVIHAPQKAANRMPQTRPLVAYVTPFALFLAFLALVSLLKSLPGDGFWLASPQYWIYPAQTVVCGALIVWFWRTYELRRFARPAFTVGIGGLVFFLWISPQQFFGFAPRLDGFDPGVFSEPFPYWATVIMRFLRLVVVVPLVEEIFWRGFLLRYLIREDFTSVPVGTFSWTSFLGVSVAFALTHSPADWIAAVVTGALYNLVAYRTKSLVSCVVVHALTNLLLGLWIMRTGQWGFW